MRGEDQQQSAMYSYVTLERRIPSDHPARQIRMLADRALARMDAELEKLYSETGRPSIAPERLLRATLLMVLYSIRSERQLMAQMNYNLLFRWFVGLEMDDPVWDVTVFTKNRERLISGAVSQQLLSAVLEDARDHALLSEEHFTVDGTLIQAWAAARSFKDKSDPPQPGPHLLGVMGRPSSHPGDGHHDDEPPADRNARSGDCARMAYPHGQRKRDHLAQRRHGRVSSVYRIRPEGPDGCGRAVKRRNARRHG